MSDRADELNNISLAAAMANSYGRDQQGFAGLVAILLENSIPAHVRIDRKPVRLFSSEKRVVNVRAVFGDEAFELADPGSGRPLVATKVKVVRGITLKNEPLRLDTWLEQLEAAIKAYAAGNEYAASAIADFLRTHGV